MHTIESNRATGGIVKTVILPFDQINNLKTELEHLKQYKISQKQLFEEAIQGYQKDKVIRLQEAQLRDADFVESVGKIQERLKQREAEQYEISKNYFQYKNELQKQKDKLADEKELLLIEKRALEDQMGQLRELALNDKEYAVDLYKQKTENFAQRFRKMTHQNENDLKVIRVQFDQFQQESTNELKRLED